MYTTPVHLLAKLQNPNDHQAWETFVEVYSPLLKEFGLRLALPDADAADITQELLLVLLRRMRTFEYQIGKRFRGYLWKTYYHLATRDYRQRGDVWPMGLEAATEDAPLMDEAEFRAKFIARMLEVKRHHFSQSAWRSFVECRLNGRTAKATAELLGLTEANVWQHCSRVTRVLRTELSGLYGEGLVS